MRLSLNIQKRKQNIHESVCKKLKRCYPFFGWDNVGSAIQESFESDGRASCSNIKTTLWWRWRPKYYSEESQNTRQPYETEIIWHKRTSTNTAFLPSGPVGPLLFTQLEEKVMHESRHNVHFFLHNCFFIWTVFWLLHLGTLHNEGPHNFKNTVIFVACVVACTCIGGDCARWLDNQSRFQSKCNVRLNSYYTCTNKSMFITDNQWTCASYVSPLKT